MTSESSVDVRVVIFLPDSVGDDYESLPPDVKVKADQVTSAIQNKRSHARVKPLKGNLRGISEFRMDYMTDTFRVYYAVEMEFCVYVIDAGIKKSKKGIDIPREQQNTLIKRRALAEKHYKANEDAFRRMYETRMALKAPPDDPHHGAGSSGH